MPSQRIGGRNARFFFAIASGGEAALLPFVKSWTVNATTDRYETTAQGDTGKTFIAGLPDASGDLDGFFDLGSKQTYTAARDGVPRKMYQYPDFINAPGSYWFTTGFADWSVSFPVDGAATMTGSWSAATDHIAVGF